MKAPIYVDDTGSITMMELRSKARRLKSREPNARADHRRLPAADDLGRDRREPRPGGVADLAQAEGARARPRRADPRALAALARGRAAPRQAADPLRPARVAARSSRTPTSSLFVYRDEYYNGEESDQQGLAELILAKHRNGPTDAVKLSFLKRYAKFADLAAGA